MSEQQWSAEAVEPLDGDFGHEGATLTVVDSTYPPLPGDSLEDTLDHLGAGTVDITAPMTTTEAQEITERIRSTADVLFVLIARAHAGKAWVAMGYGSFADYVREEFNMSRSRAYQILDQARVIEAIEAAVPAGTALEITEAAARDLKQIIGEVVPAVEAATAGVAPDEAGEMVEEIIGEFRHQVQERREQDALDAEERAAEAAERRANGDLYTGPPGGYSEPIYDDEDDIDPALVRRNVQAAYDLFSALNALQSLPDVDSVINTLPPERRMQVNANLAPALDWLTEFRDAWNAQPWQNGIDEDEEFVGDVDEDDLD